MIVLKCKMCGGDIEVNDGMSVTTCKYCGSAVTIPRITTDRKARLFNKANEYRASNEFDKAYDAYRVIVEEDESEAEAYWGMILSEYGIEYVEDPITHKRVPTCHRTQVQPIISTANYSYALKFADAEQKMLYRDEAEKIDELQREILSVSSRVDPYDVFICYKETDDFGDRTQDSVMAQDIYEELENRGIRTFFARVSLEDKIGLNYEPYIYAALSSATVMVVVAQDKGNINAIWVKNEWMRFLKFKKNHAEKIIIPAYKNMTPYDFPPELARFQGQDMSKIGAIQDLIHGIQKILNDNSNTKSADSQNEIKRLMAQNEALLREKNEALTSDNKNNSHKGIGLFVGIAVTVLVIVIIFISGNGNQETDKNKYDTENTIKDESVDTEEITQEETYATQDTTEEYIENENLWEDVIQGGDLQWLNQTDDFKNDLEENDYQVEYYGVVILDDGNKYNCYCFNGNEPYYYVGIEIDRVWKYADSGYDSIYYDENSISINEQFGVSDYTDLDIAIDLKYFKTYDSGINDFYFS
ncbi:MAG: toll/interleukin-1 receptor domain-containing protein, partial [Butyrivibrio sp.]|nr:toll/interleukin-1 receptor domain-containing protein [Butyrivibrio sp.]